MDKHLKLTVIFSAIFLFSALAIVFSHIERSLFLGMEILPAEELEEHIKDKSQSISPQDVGNLISFQGSQIPFDIERNIFYVEADPTTRLVIDGSSSDVGVYVINDEQEGFGNVEQSITKATQYRILIDTPDSYIISNLVLTNMPIIQVEVQAIVGTGDVYNPVVINAISTKEKDEVGVSEKTISGWAKENDETHTVTLKTTNKDYTKRKAASLFSLGKYDAYHLYPIDSISDAYRMKTGYWMYNQINSTDAYDIPTEFVELFIGNYYQGLYLLAPRTDDDFYGLDDKDTLHKTEDDRNTDGYAPQDIYQADTPVNLSEYMLYIQAAYAYDNIFDDVTVIQKEDDTYFYPGGFRYTLGTLPGRYRWRGYNYTNRWIGAEDFGVEENEEIFDETISFLWSIVRQDALADGGVYECEAEVTEDLWDSGYYARTLWTVTEDGQIALPEEEVSEDGLKVYEGVQSGEVLARFYYLDGYGAPSNPAPVEVASDDVYVPQPGDPIIADITVPDYEGYGDIYMVVKDADGTRRLPLYFKGKEVYAFLPAYTDLATLSIEYDATNYSIEVDGKVIRNKSRLPGYNLDTTYILSVSGRKAGASLQITPYSLYQFILLQSENLSTIYIETANGTMAYLDASKENYEPGSLECVSVDGSVSVSAEIEKMHLRGSTSAGLKQKGYTVRLSEAASIDGMAEAQKWCLISNGLDASKIRNALAYSYARDIDLPYAIDYRFVDVYFNGEYNGNYILCEAIEVAENRMDANDVSALLKVDRLPDDGDAVYFHTDATSLEVLYSVETSEEYYQMLRDKVELAFTLAQNCENDKDFDRVKEAFDVEILTKIYLINFITNEPDHNALSTFYYYKDNTEKLYCGPVWDFDRGFGAEEVHRGRYYFLNAYGNGPAEELIDNPEFAEDVRQMFLEYAWAGEQLIDNIKLFSEYIRSSRQMSYIRFGVQAIKDTGNDEANLSYIGNYARQRLELMENTILHPENYHRINIGGCIYWLRDGEYITEDFEETVCSSWFGWKYFAYADGTRFRNDVPITTDLTLSGVPISTDDTEDATGEDVVEAEQSALTYEEMKSIADNYNMAMSQPYDDHRYYFWEIAILLSSAILTLFFGITYLHHRRTKISR